MGLFTENPVKSRGFRTSVLRKKPGVFVRFLTLFCGFLRKRKRPANAVFTGLFGVLRIPANLTWRRGRDSNPRYLAVHTLSKRARSTTLTPLLIWGLGTEDWGLNNSALTTQYPVPSPQSSVPSTQYSVPT